MLARIWMQGLGDQAPCSEGHGAQRLALVPLPHVAQLRLEVLHLRRECLDPSLALLVRRQRRLGGLLGRTQFLQFVLQDAPLPVELPILVPQILERRLGGVISACGFRIRWLPRRLQLGSATPTAVVIRDFMQWALQGITVGETDRKKAGAYISHLICARALAPKTVERYRSSLSTLWAWLEEKGITDQSNPWLKHRSIRPSVQTKRKPLSDEQLVSVLAGSYDTPTYRQVLA